MTNKEQKIFFAGKDTFAAMCRDILVQIGTGKRIIKITLFNAPADNGEYISNLSVFKEAVAGYFGENAPLVAYVAQPCVTAGMAAEVTYMPDDENLVCEYGDGYILLRGDSFRELISEGVVPSSLSGSIREQSESVFARIGKMLSDNGFSTDDIYRQWNYIEQITSMHNGRQNYQDFNDARSLFYEENGWHSNYPAATGIGTSRGGVMIEIMATCGGNPANCPIDNPLQTAAHDYSQRVLIGNGEGQKTTPKFERARIAGENIYISGTAAIRGEESLSSLDITGQTAATMEIMNTLIAPDNIPIPCRSTVYDTLRVYVKREEDILPAQEYLQEHYPAAQKHFVVSDVCRPELLIEIEGTAHVVFV